MGWSQLAGILLLSLGIACQAPVPAAKTLPPAAALAPAAPVPEAEVAKAPLVGTELERMDHLKGVFKTVRSQDLGSVRNHPSGKLSVAGVVWTAEGAGLRPVKGLNLAAINGKPDKGGLDNSAVRAIDQAEIAGLVGALDRIISSVQAGEKASAWSGFESRSGILFAIQNGVVTVRIDTVSLNAVPVGTLKELRNLLTSGEAWLSQQN